MLSLFSIHLSMEDSNFIRKFKLLEGMWKYLYPNEWEEVYKDYRVDEIKNKIFVLNTFNEYFSTDSNKDPNIISFIQFLGNKESFKDSTIANRIKQKLDSLIDRPYIYGFYLKTLFAINRDEKRFYIEEFERLEKQWKLHFALNKTFFKIFQNIEINDYVLICLKKIILDQSNFSTRLSTEEWFEYLISLKNQDFKKYFLRLLTFFTSDKEKEKLRYRSEYRSILYFSEKESADLNLLERLLNKFNQSRFSNKELEIIKTFVFSEYIFSSKKYSSKILNNKFIEGLFNFLFQRDNNLIIELINKNKEEYSFRHWIWAKFIVKYLNEQNIGFFIASQEENIDLLFCVYDILKYEKKKTLLLVIENNKTLLKKLQKIEKERVRQRKKYKQEDLQRLQREKKEFIKLFSVNDKWYYPKAFQDYYYYLKDNELEQKFTKSELGKINRNLKKQIENYLNQLNIKTYDEDKIRDNLLYEKKTANSYSISRNFQFLRWVFEISRYLNFSIDKYYKIYILFYPWLSWDNENEILKFLEWKVTEEDIDYMLKVYTEDLHNNAIGFRYYCPQNLCYFYDRFWGEFNSIQNQKLQKICLEMLEKVEYKNHFLEIYSNLVNKDKFKELYKEPTFNYFKDILNPQQNITEEQYKTFDYAKLVNKFLIIKFSDQEALLRRIKQIQDGKVECKERDFNDGDVFYAWWWLYNELSDFSDEDSFSYVFSGIPNIDIRDNILNLLEISFQLELKIKKKEISEDYLLYANYLKQIFYKYIGNLEDNLRDLAFYDKIITLKSKYKNCYLNLLAVSKCFNIDEQKIWEDLGLFSKTWSKTLDFYQSQINDQEKNKNLLAENRRLKEEFLYLKNITGVISASCIIFVEWESDKIHLDTFFDLFFDNSKKRPFVVPSGWSRVLTYFISDSLKRETQIPVIWIYDFDKSGVQEYKKLSCKWFSYFEENYFNGRSKKYDQKDIFIGFWPIPDNEIKNQVIYENENQIYQDFDEEAKFEIEHLFYGIDERLDSYLFEDEVCVWGGKYKKLKISDSKKTDFARNPNKCIAIEDVFQYIDATVLYKNFKPIGEMVKRITQSI